ncbi:hypothetical protein F4810DRAFT_717882 [Camillea tinctor]|nr:hypothetical protein F4810DRAFT_717882 [Camillea tinctor]
MAQYPAEFGLIGTTHFWDYRTSSYASIGRLRDRGPDYSQEDIVWHAWQSICRLYFPEISEVANGDRWETVREAYRGTARAPSDFRPDIITIKFVSTGVPGHFRERDYLWIECKASSRDHPFEWKTSMREAIAKLNGAHPDRELLLLLAVGHKWMWFFWDPNHTLRSGQPLCMATANGASWRIDGRIKQPNNVPWVDSRGRINTPDAMSIDMWSTVTVGHGANAEQRIANWRGLEMLEEFLVAIRATPLLGFNPAHF